MVYCFKPNCQDCHNYKVLKFFCNNYPKVNVPMQLVEKELAREKLSNLKNKL